MIDKQPGNSDDMTAWLMTPYEEDLTVSPVLIESNKTRKSSVLNPDGSPIEIIIPRYKLGFDLGNSYK